MLSKVGQMMDNAGKESQKIRQMPNKNSKKVGFAVNTKSTTIVPFFNRRKPSEMQPRPP